MFSFTNTYYNYTLEELLTLYYSDLLLRGASRNPGSFIFSGELLKTVSLSGAGQGLMYNNDFVFVASELFLGIGAIIALLSYVFWCMKQNTGYIANWDFFGNILGILRYTCIGSFILVCQPAVIPGDALSGMWGNNHIVFLSKVACLLLYVLLLSCFKHLSSAKSSLSPDALLLQTFALLALLICISSNDFLTLYLSLELYAIVSYILVTVVTKSVRSSEAGLKYLILGTVFSLLLLAGIYEIYTGTGSIFFQDIQLFSLLEDPINSRSWGIGMVFVLVALLFKIGLAPFHFWLPAVYEGAPTAVLFFLATVSKLALCVVVMRMFIGYNLITINSALRFTLVVCGIASLLIGAGAALYQTKIKSLIAYSGITNVGYFVLAISAHTVQSCAAAFLYVFIYVVTTFGLLAALFLYRIGRQSRVVNKLAALSNRFRMYPSVAWSLAILLFSTAGLPPLVGFSIKFEVLTSVLSTSIYSSSIIFFILLSSAVSVFYYVRLIKIMFFDKTTLWTATRPYSRTSAATIVAAAVFVVFSFFAFGVFAVTASNIATNLFLGY